MPTTKASVFQTLSQSHQLLSSNLKFVLSQFLLFAISYLVVILIFRYATVNLSANFKLSLFLLSFAVAVWLSQGFAQVILDLTSSNQKQTEFIAGLKSQASNYLRVLIGNIIKAGINFGLLVVPVILVFFILLVLGLFMPGGRVFNFFGISLKIVGFLIVVSTLYVNIRLYFYELIIVDQRVNPLKAISMAMDISQGRSVEIFQIMLASLLLNLAGLFLFLIGGLYTSPLSKILITSYYHRYKV